MGRRSDTLELMTADTNLHLEPATALSLKQLLGQVADGNQAVFGELYDQLLIRGSSVRARRGLRRTPLVFLGIQGASVVSTQPHTCPRDRNAHLIPKQCWFKWVAWSLCGSVEGRN
jgi:hypothetical protein